MEVGKAPKFANLRQEDRQLLLHEGAGSGVMAAYVEIIFDNSDGRLSVESDEVVLRRTVGHKKDEFFLNRKRVQKSEVTSLLESGGFSKSNPYYIVQQGKVSNLCVMKDKDRLELLKEVAGTTVYEERRAESLKITQETLSKQEQINEVLQFIEDRLHELEQEKDELKDYEQLDKLRRAYEYNLYDKELSRANLLLEEVEISRDEDRTRQLQLFTSIRELQDALQMEDDSLSLAKAATERILIKKLTKESDLKSLLSRDSELEIRISELETSINVQTQESERLSKELEEVLSLIAICESELTRVDPIFENKSQDLSSAQRELEGNRRRIETLYGKQGRGQQFRTKKDRDSFLQQQINSLQSQLSSTNDILVKLRQQIANEEERLKFEQNFLSKAEEEQRTRQVYFKDISKRIQEKVALRNDLQEDKKKGWKELETLQEKIQEAKHDLERGKQQLSSSLPRSISQGLATADAIATELNLTGYYGPVIDNFELKNDAFRTAVEVAAGNALFHVIVDTDATAAMLIKELDRRRAGRLTFLPLNRLRPPKIRYPDANDVRPLIDVAINYDDDFDAAIRHVFGGKLLARDLDTAAHFSKEFDLDAVTKEGDVVNRRGGFEGGFRDDRESKIGTIMKIREATNLFIDLQAKEAEFNKQLESIERNISDTQRELQKHEAEREHHKSSSELMSNELSSRSKQYNNAMKALSDRRSDIEAQEREIIRMEQQIRDYQEEQNAPLQNKLTESEKQELQTLLSRQNPLSASIDDIEGQLMEINVTREKLRADLSNNLYKRRDELRVRLTIIDSLQSSGSSHSSSDVKDLDFELASLTAERSLISSQMKALVRELDETEQQIARKQNELLGLEKAVEKLRLEDVALHDQLTEVTKNHDKVLNKRTMLLDAIQAKQRMIRDLGTLPKNEVDDSKNLSEKDLMRELKEVNERLKRYSSVNRKALDQYINFAEQRDNLLSRQEELDRDFKSIQQMIETLDAQKEEAILRTFRGVSHHFSEVFQEIVPGGSGRLVMRTTDDMTDENADEGNHESKTASGSQGIQVSVSRFLGVQVRVNFAGSAQQFEMQQLSGGQKALVALALIFAIQRCDPAPFYLFDEIDQALDANYRAGVARLIQKQTESADAPAQFITTTFRPELVAVASKCYGIALQNKVSNIYPLEKEDAKNFVENIMQEESLGQVTNIPQYPRQSSLNESTSFEPSSKDVEQNPPIIDADMESEADSGDDEVMEDFAETEKSLGRMAVTDKFEAIEAERSKPRRGEKRTAKGTVKNENEYA